MGIGGSRGLFSYVFARNTNMSMSDQNIGSMTMNQMTYDVVVAWQNLHLFLQISMIDN